MEGYLDIIVFLLCLNALYYNFLSLKALVIAELPGASWKEVYKMAVNLAVIIYIYLV